MTDGEERRMNDHSGTGEVYLSNIALNARVVICPAAGDTPTT